MPKLETKERIVKNQPVNVYQVTVIQVSGDGDDYNNEVFTYKSADIALPYVNLMDFIMQKQKWGGYNDRKELVKCIEEEFGAEVDSGDLGDFVSEVCGYDVTNGMTLATIDEIKISWFDENGVEYLVEYIK